MSASRWADEVAAEARAYWTPERTAALAGGKRLLLPPAEAAPLLRAIGLLHRGAAMPPRQVRKYFQVQHMVALLGPALRTLRGGAAPIRVVDAACGRSYLSIVLAWCARHVWGERLEVRGVDRDPDVIAEGRRRAALLGLDDVTSFEAAPLDGVDAAGADAVIALHACDTATCDAIALGVAGGARMIAVAPCCQAELARAWAAAPGGAFAPVHRTPHLRRELAAQLTDTMRTLLLAACGYQVAAIELVPTEHSAKNTLIRAHGRAAPDPAARAEYEALVTATGGAGLALADRLWRMI